MLVVGVGAIWVWDESKWDRPDLTHDLLRRVKMRRIIAACMPSFSREFDHAIVNQIASSTT